MAILRENLLNFQNFKIETDCLKKPHTPEIFFHRIWMPNRLTFNAYMRVFAQNRFFGLFSANNVKNSRFSGPWSGRPTPK